ncbi:MAG: hypothetical protein RL693_2283 [Verrucomicrobiota bacterium]|jgi:cbb3-type cytochrome c oxidase subunit II
MKSSQKFIYGLGICFGLPWLILIIIPALSAQKLMPKTYDKEKDGIEGLYPGAGIHRQGQLVYLREGCVQCHTQMIRPTFAGMSDGIKKGWGSDQSETPPDVIRSSNMRDYLGEPVAPLGVQRNGPDLANVGYRLKDKAAVHVHLYAPRSVTPWSIMPNFRHLYKTQPIQGNGSPNALDLPKEYAPKKGFEVVPTQEAIELVSYLFSLKKDAPLPGQVVAEAKK